MNDLRHSRFVYELHEKTGRTLSWCRIYCLHQYARDWVYKVGMRYVRRYQRLPHPNRIIAHVAKVSDRFRWHNPRAHIHFPHFTRHYPRPFSSGPFCPIGLVGVDGEQYLEHYDIRCNHCGEPMRLRNSKVVTEYTVMPRLYWSEYKYRSFLKCENAMCVEVRKFLNREHDLLKAAEKIGVPANIPQYLSRRLVPPEERLAIGSAALLDFQARYMAKLKTLGNQRESNG